jgi:predicted MFS family arabinose efflux permease
VTPLQLLLGVPYLLFALSLPLPVAAVAVAAASFGFGGGLLLQERLIELTPPELRGQALGLHSAGMLTFQAVAATIAGVVAGWLTVGLAMAVMGALSLLVTLYLAPRLRRPDQVPVPEPVPA